MFPLFVSLCKSFQRLNFPPDPGFQLFKAYFSLIRFIIQILSKIEFSSGSWIPAFQRLFFPYSFHYVNPFKNWIFLPILDSSFSKLIFPLFVSLCKSFQKLNFAPDPGFQLFKAHFSLIRFIIQILSKIEFSSGSWIPAFQGLLFIDSVFFGGLLFLLNSLCASFQRCTVSSGSWIPIFT